MRAGCIKYMGKSIPAYHTLIRHVAFNWLLLEQFFSIRNLIYLKKLRSMIRYGEKIFLLPVKCA